jgi:hypothetical protein
MESLKINIDTVLIQLGEIETILTILLDPWFLTNKTK